MPKVSVIVPVYNTEKYLKRCIGSILNQTFKDTEIILVNDGSTDNSLNVLLEYEKLYLGKVKVLTGPNNGVSDARNKGLDISKGEYVLFIDSDDCIKEDMIELLYNKAIINDADIVRCANETYFENIYIGKSNVECYPIDNGTILNPIEEKEYVFKEIPNVWNKLIRKSLFENIRFRENMKWEDGPVIRPITALAKKIVYLKDAKYKYMASFKNTTLSDFFNPNVKVLDVFQGMDDLEENFKKINLYDEFKDIILTDQIFSVLLRVQNAGLWFKLSNDDRKMLTNSLVNLIEIKYGDWVDNASYLDFKHRHSFFKLTMDYIEKYVLSEKLRQETDEAKIYKNVQDTFKNY